MLKDRGRRKEWQMSLLIPLADFRVNVFNLKMDRIVQSLELRFVQHKQLYKRTTYPQISNYENISPKTHSQMNRNTVNT